MQSIKCPNCRNQEFEQETEEIYKRYINSDGKVIGFESDLTHDLEFGKIYCTKCGYNCDEVFENIEIKFNILNSIQISIISV